MRKVLLQIKRMQKLLMYRVYEKIYISDFNFDSNFYGNLIFEKATFSPNISKGNVFYIFD